MKFNQTVLSYILRGKNLLNRSLKHKEEAASRKRIQLDKYESYQRKDSEIRNSEGDELNPNGMRNNEEESI